jgi:hypothetical protein
MAEQPTERKIDTRPLWQKAGMARPPEPAKSNKLPWILAAALASAVGTAYLEKDNLFPSTPAHAAPTQPAAKTSTPAADAKATNG